MGCNCGGNKTRKYLVTTKTGDQKEVDSLSAAMAIVRSQGGHYVIVKR